MPAATAAAEPPLDPPAMRSIFHGLWTGPKWESVDVPPWPNSSRLVLPMMIAPAARKRSTKVCVRLRNPIRQNLRSARGQHAGRLKHVFDRHRYAVKRAAIVSAGNFFIRFFRFGGRLFAQNRDEGVELVFELLQTRQSRSHGLGRRQLARRDEFRKIGQIQFKNISGSHGQTFLPAGWACSEIHGVP